MMYNDKGPVPDEADFVIPFGKAEIKRTGSDVTLVATYLAWSRSRFRRQKNSRMNFR